MICKRVKIYAREKKCDHIMERKAWYVCVYMCLCTNIHLYMHRIWNDVRTVERGYPQQWHWRDSNRYVGRSFCISFHTLLVISLDVLQWKCVASIIKKNNDSFKWTLIITVLLCLFILDRIFAYSFTSWAQSLLLLCLLILSH